MLLPFVSADIIIPAGWSLLNIQLIIGIIIIESIVLFLLINNYFNKKFQFWKVLSIVLIANIITSFIGAFIPIYNLTLSFFFWTFLISVIVEFIIYILAINFILKNKELKKKELFIACVLVNMITYVLIYILHNFGVVIR